MSFADFIKDYASEFTSLVTNALNIVANLCLEYEFNFVYHDCVEITLKHLPFTITIDDADNHMIWVEDPLGIRNCNQDCDALYAILKCAM